MADERARALERQAVQGDPDAAAQLLRERIRQGQVSEKRVRLAAFLGHPTSAAALGAAAPDPPSDYGQLADQLCAEVEVGVRAVLALAELSLGLVRDAPWIEANCEPALRAARDWALCPCADHAQVAHTVAAGAEDRGDAAEDASTDTGDWWSHYMVHTAHHLPRVVALAAGLPEPNPEDPAGPETRPLLEAALGDFAGFPYNAPRSLEENRVGLAEALVPWLLGEGDPLAEPEDPPEEC